MQSPHDYRVKIEKTELNLIKKLKVKNMLEVCSGDGKNLVFFSKQGYNVTGIESEDKYIKKSVKIIKHPIFSKRFPFKDEQFDFVYSYQYLNHNFKDKIEEVFKEIYRVLKKGGVFSIKITDIEQFNLKNIEGDIYEEQDPEFPKIRYRRLADQTFAKLEGDEIGIPHYGFYETELAQSLRKVGFKLISMRKIRWNIAGNFVK